MDYLASMEDQDGVEFWKEVDFFICAFFVHTAPSKEQSKIDDVCKLISHLLNVKT